MILASLFSRFRKSSVLFAVVVFIVGGVLNSPAAYAADPEIFVVDVPKVLQESVAGKALRKTLEAETKKREAKLQKDKVEIQKLREDLAKQSAVLSTEALSDKQRSLERKEKDFARRLQDERDELGKFNGEQLGKLVKEIDVVIKALAAKKDYPLVIEKDQRIVLFVQDRFDITKDVIEALDARKIGL